MKNSILHFLLVISLLLVGSLSSFSQGNVELVQSLQTFGSQNLEYRKQQQNLRDVKGTPYLTEDFLRGEVFMGNTLYTGIFLRYNVYSDRFEVRLDEQTIELDPVKNTIDTVYYSDQRFVRRFLQSEKNMALTYMVVIYEDGKGVLLKKYKVNLNPAKEAGAYVPAKPAELTPAQPDYYLGRGGEQILIKGVKSFAEFYKLDVKQVKSHLKTGKLKIQEEEDLSLICAYCSNQSGIY